MSNTLSSIQKPKFLSPSIFSVVGKHGRFMPLWHKRTCNVSINANDRRGEVESINYSWPQRFKGHQFGITLTLCLPAKPSIVFLTHLFLITSSYLSKGRTCFLSQNSQWEKHPAEERQLLNYSVSFQVLYSCSLNSGRHHLLTQQHTTNKPQNIIDGFPCILHISRKCAWLIGSLPLRISGFPITVLHHKKEKL